VLFFNKPRREIPLPAPDSYTALILRRAAHSGQFVRGNNGPYKEKPAHP
jgi:hypothetical protein